MKKEKPEEIKVYVIDLDKTDFDFREAESNGDYDDIMDEAERLGTVYSLQGFQEALNNEELFLDNSFILFYPIPEVDY